ncbi:MAG: Cof-type HAD-IIB family hydrolase [Alphaproteobacteria bacterium]|nr:Cof-type HAD-IIB family hydrolase [Alphaproteobacteria bacterium]
MIKAVFFDIDGTLVPHAAYGMPDSTRQALEAVRQKGVKLFLSTGRSPNGIGFLEKEFDFDGVISFNGQYCFDRSGVLRQDPLPAEEVLSVLPYLEEKQISANFETLEGDGFNFINDRVLDFARRFHVVEKELRVVDIASAERTVYHMLLFVTSQEEEDVMRRLPHCKALRWCSDFVNVINRDGGKSVGISAFCQKYGFEREEIMAFGDGGNDVDMLEYAGIGVAMGNAETETKAAADYVTTAVDDNGIYNALKHFEVI